MGRVVLNGPSYSVDFVAQPFWTESILPTSRWTPPSESAVASLPHDSGLDAKPEFSWDSVGYGGHVKVPSSSFKDSTWARPSTGGGPSRRPVWR